MWTADGILLFLGLPNTLVAPPTKEKGSNHTPAATKGKAYTLSNTHLVVAGRANCNGSSGRRQLADTYVSVVRFNSGPNARKVRDDLKLYF